MCRKRVGVLQRSGADAGSGPSNMFLFFGNMLHCVMHVKNGSVVVKDLRYQNYASADLFMQLYARCSLRHLVPQRCIIESLLGAKGFKIL